MSPEIRRPKNKNSQYKTNVFNRLYTSPSPFHSSKQLNQCYLTKKGKKRLLSSKVIKIPRNTLYVVDKVVRKKLVKDK